MAFLSQPGLLLCIVALVAATHYEPTWQSLDSRPIPQWYNDAKFGIFNHWGLYSVAGMRAWLWWYWKGWKTPWAVEYMKSNYPPGFTYQDFAPLFTAEFFNASRFAEVVKNSGARYFVFTTKHHEGYTMWPSKTAWNWNSNDTGPHRDIVGELAVAFKRVAPAVKFGLYFSQFEFYNPIFLQDKANGWTTQDYTVSYPQLLELVNNYDPQVIWSDGDWDGKNQVDASYWKSKEFLAWLYNSSPVKDTVVVNDRWGNGTKCRHGGFYNCMDQYNPGVLRAHKWENAMTLNSKAWAYTRTMQAQDVLTMEQLLKDLAMTVSCNGNMLLNIGPTHDGRYIPIFEERLQQMGVWLRFNGEGIYDTKPWIYQNDSLNGDVWYTSKTRSQKTSDWVFNRQDQQDTIVYAIVLKWPDADDSGMLKLGSVKPTSETRVTMLGTKQRFKFTFDGQKTTVALNALPWNKLPTLWAWVLRFEYLSSDETQPFMQ